MKTEQALQLAKELIAGPRAKTYGDKIQNHANIAKLWTAYLDKEITAHDAAVMMALLKVARTKFGAPTEDTCLLYTSPSPRDGLLSRMPSSA